MINGKTQILGIFGDPIEHSLSPVMQNAAIVAAGIDAVFVPFHVLPQQLEQAVESLRSLSILGVNVTVPHKEAVIPFLDELDPLAQMIGAVNTIVNRKGVLTGYNTDGAGLVRSLCEDLGFNVPGGNVVIIGAGGATRAAVVALADSGVRQISIANRTHEKALRLADEFKSHFPETEFIAFPFGSDLLENQLGNADLLINTTSVGLHGENFDFNPVSFLQKQAAFYDMVYAPEPTPMQRSASECGIRFADGRGMLVGQGEIAFRHWFSCPPPAGIMKKAVLK